eukprot:5410542-Amphidinium_carterae.2
MPNSKCEEEAPNAHVGKDDRDCIGSCIVAGMGACSSFCQALGLVHLGQGQNRLPSLHNLCLNGICGHCCRCL